MKCGSNNMGQFRNDYNGWLEAATRHGKPSREPAWSESIAVGGKEFIENIKQRLGVKAIHQEIIKWNRKKLLLK